VKGVILYSGKYGISGMTVSHFQTAVTSLTFKSKMVKIHTTCSNCKKHCISPPSVFMCCGSGKFLLLMVGLFLQHEIPFSGTCLAALAVVMSQLPRFVGIS
jgi:hypothetical protein